MWQYNYDYLSHGLHGFKYIDKKRGKNGKWQYIYPDSAEGKRIDAGRRTEEGMNHPLTNPNRSLLYGRTPGSSVPTSKPNITKNRKTSNDTASTSSKSGGSAKDAIKNLGTDVAGKLKGAYDKTLNSEEFKAYQKDKRAREEFNENEREIFDTAWSMYARAGQKNSPQEQEQVRKEEYEKYISELKTKYPADLVEFIDRSVKRSYEENEKRWKEEQKRVNSILEKQNKNGFSTRVETSGR